MDTEKQRQHRRDDARLTERGNARSEQLLMVPMESLTNRVLLEWIRTSKALLVFRYEISDLLMPTINVSVTLSMSVAQELGIDGIQQMNVHTRWSCIDNDCGVYSDLPQ